VVTYDVKSFKIVQPSSNAVIGCNNFASWIFSNKFNCAKSFAKVL